MEVFNGSEKIGNLNDVTISKSGKDFEIRGLWIGYYEPVNEQLDPYTLKDGNDSYEGCWLKNSNGVAEGSVVTFDATRKVSSPSGTTQTKRVKLIPRR